MTYRITDKFTSISQSIGFYWNEMSASVKFFTMRIKYTDLTSLGIDSQIEIIWNILPLWSLIFISFGLLGAFLMALPHFRVMGKVKPGNYPFGFIGLLAGLIVTGVEYGLFLILWLFEEWGEQQPDLNYILLACFIIGWIGLIVSYFFSRKIPTYGNSYLRANFTKEPSIKQTPIIEPVNKTCSTCGHTCQTNATFCESYENHFERTLKGD